MKINLGGENQILVELAGLLVFANVSQLFIPWKFTWIVSVILVGLLFLVAKRGGLKSSDVGLSKQTIKRGLAWGGAAALVIILAVGIVYKIDSRVFIDSRYHNSFGRALYLALVIVPLHTVLIEELAFRGVLWSSIRQIKDAKYATVASSLIFGLWHIAPSLNLDQSSRAVGEIVGHGSAGHILPIIGAVIVTTIAGIGLCELRRRSDSLIAPILAHWALNGGVVILAALAWAH